MWDPCVQQAVQHDPLHLENFGGIRERRGQSLQCLREMTERTPPPGKTNYVITLSLFPYVGRLGSGVRVSVNFQKKSSPGSVLRQRKAMVGVMT